MKTRHIILALLVFAAIILAGCAKKSDGSGASGTPPPAESSASQDAAPAAPPAAPQPEASPQQGPRPVTVLSTLPDLVVDETIEIKGKTSPGKRIFINGQEAVPGPTGEFRLPVNLQVGKNEIKVVTLGKEKVEDTRTVNVERRPTGPRLTVISPEISDTENITISGQTEKGSVVYVNTNLARPDREGNFTSTVQLREGVNQIKVTSTNRDGGTASAQKTVTFKPTNPRLQVIIPDESRSKQVTISGITDTNTVLIIYVNEVKTDINLSNGVFSGNITLQDGVNSVNVTAINKWGKSTTVSRNILYNTI